MKEVHLVLDVDDMVMCVFASKSDAEMFISACGMMAEGWTVSTRNIHHGQPDHAGFNK